MGFSEQFDQALASPSPLLRRMERLLTADSGNGAALESLALQAHEISLRKFGRTMRLFAPVYLSNECINNCAYCGFSRDNPILRLTLTPDQVVKESRHLLDQGFRTLLLVAGEHPKFVTDGYLEECLRRLAATVPSLGIEVGPMETPEYRRMVDAGAESLVVYQETYDRAAYAEYHTAGPKKDFDWRLDCPERGHDGGFRRIGVGALFGLADWRTEALGLAAHLEYLQKHCWKASFTVAFPRLRPAAGEFQPRTVLSDRDLVQLICAFRILFPEVGIISSTREPAALRDQLVPLGVTHMSAGSRTEPGGYTNQGEDDLHLTVKGRRKELGKTAQEESDGAEEQFGIADKRSPEEVAKMLRQQGYDPVWKDWDASILEVSPAPAILSDVS